MNKKICIFCPSVKATPTVLDENTRPEHIIQNKLGGRLERRDLICDDCNGFFGSTIDKVLVNDFLWLRNGLEIKSGRRQTPPHIQGVDSPAGKIKLGPGWKPQQAKIGRTAIDDKTFRITAPDTDSGIEAIVHYLRSKGVSTVEDFRKKFQISAKTTFSRLPGASIDVELGGPDASRAIAKIALEYLAYLRGDIIHEQAFNVIRNYIRLPFDKAVHTNQEPAYVDFKTILPRPQELFHNFKSMLCPDFPVDWLSPQHLFARFNPEISHFIGIWTAQMGNAHSLVAEVNLFGLFRWTVELSEQWTGSPFSAAYVISPITGISKESLVPFIVKIPANWKHDRFIDLDVFANRIWQAKLLCERYQEMKAHLALRLECAQEVLGLSEIPPDRELSLAEMEAMDKLYESRKERFGKDYKIEKTFLTQCLTGEVEKRLKEKQE